jgi:hypothetical protein
MRMRAVRWIGISAVMRSLTGAWGWYGRPSEGDRELFRTAPDADFADALRAATNGGWALGDALQAADRQGARSSRL